MSRIPPRRASHIASPTILATAGTTTTRRRWADKTRSAICRSAAIPKPSCPMLLLPSVGNIRTYAERTPHGQRVPEAWNRGRQAPVPSQSPGRISKGRPNLPPPTPDRRAAAPASSPVRIQDRRRLAFEASIPAATCHPTPDSVMSGMRHRVAGRPALRAPRRPPP